MAYYKDPNVEALYDIVNKHNVKNTKKIEELKNNFRTILDDEVKNINIKSRRTFTFSNHSHLLNVALKRSQWATDLLMEYKQDIHFDNSIDYQIFLTLAVEKLPFDDIKYFMDKHHSDFIKSHNIKKENQLNKTNYNFEDQDAFQKYFDFYYINNHEEHAYILHNASKNKDFRVFDYILDNSGLNFNNLAIKLDLSDQDNVIHFLNKLKDNMGALNINNILGSQASYIDRSTLHFLIDNAELYFLNTTDKDSQISNLFYFVHLIESLNLRDDIDIFKETDRIFNTIKVCALDSKTDNIQNIITYKINHICLSYYNRFHLKIENEKILDSHIEPYFGKKEIQQVNPESFKMLILKNISDFHILFDSEYFNRNSLIEKKFEEYKFLFGDLKINFNNPSLSEHISIHSNSTKFKLPSLNFLKNLIKAHHLEWKDLDLNLMTLVKIYRQYGYEDRSFDQKDIEKINFLLDMFVNEDKKNDYRLSKEINEQYKEELSSKRYISHSFISSYLNMQNHPYLLLFHNPQFKEKILKCHLEPEIILENIFHLEKQYLNSSERKEHHISFYKTGMTFEDLIRDCSHNFILDYKDKINLNNKILSWLDDVPIDENFKRPYIIISALEKEILLEKINDNQIENIKRKRI